jgi:hypothetical protein
MRAADYTCKSGTFNAESLVERRFALDLRGRGFLSGEGWPSEGCSYSERRPSKGILNLIKADHPLDIDQPEPQSDSELESFPGTSTDNDIAACTFDAELSDGESTDEEDTPPQGNADRLARQAHKRALRAAKQQKWKLARGLFEKAAVDFPSNVRILTSAAIFEQKQSRFGASRELFERAVAAGPQNAVALQVIYAWTQSLTE